MVSKKEIKELAERIKKIEADFYRVNGARILELLNVCEQYQGQCLGVDHGPGSWATTYSDKFISASTELYLIFSQCKLYSPLVQLSRCFIKRNIKSCRGSKMSLDKVEYLYKTHLARRIPKNH